MPDIPSEIRDLAGARDALLAYMDWWKPRGPRISQFQSLDSPNSPRRSIERPFNVTRQMLAKLQMHTAAGPVVRAQPDTSTGYLVGRTSAAGREVIALRLPDGPLSDYAADTVSVLAEAVGAAGVVRGLMVRCLAIADSNAGGRNRQSTQFRGEGAALGAFGGELGAVVIDLADLFLEQWHREAERRGGVTTPHRPAVKAQLRSS